MDWKIKNTELMNNASALAKEMSKSLGTLVISASVNNIKDARFDIATKGSAICVGITTKGKELFEMYYEGDIDNLSLHKKVFA